MSDNTEPLTKQDLLEALGGLEQREYAMRNDARFKNLETFQATGTERLSSLEAAGRLAALELKVAEIEKKLDRRQ